MPRNIADETVEFVGNFSEVLIRAPAKFQKFAKMFRVLAQHRRLALLDLGDDHQCVLDVFDGLLDIAHRRIVHPS